MSPATSPTPSASTSSAPTSPVLDSTNPKSPLFTLDYKVPVHSFADSVAILRRAQGQPTTPPAPSTSSSAPNKASILAQLRRRSPSPSTPLDSADAHADLSHVVDPEDPKSPAFSPPGYRVPVHNLRDSVKILNDRFKRKDKKGTSSVVL